MGYRYYFYAAPKKLVSEIEKCTTNDEYFELCKRNDIDVEEYDSERRCAPYKLGREVYEFGKEIDFYEATEKCKDLFLSKELSEEYGDYGVKVCTQDVFKAAIESYGNRITEIYKDLLREKSKSPWNDLSQIDRLKNHAADYLHYWDNRFFKPYNADLNNPVICNSWLYEHAIFELVRCYKTFDWEKDDLLFMGW